jgi:hypothetical protein
MQDLIANAQRAEMIRRQNDQLEELKKQNRPQPIPKAEPQERTLKCPACAEWIKAEAKICKHCRTEVGKVFAAIIAKEEAEARAVDLEQKRKAEEDQKRIQKELDDEAAATAERDKVRQERIAEEDLLFREAKAARKAKLKATLKSRKGKAFVALSTAVAMILGTGIWFGVNQSERSREIALLNEEQACDKFSGTLDALAAPIREGYTIDATNKDLVNQLKAWSVENGSNNVLYKQLVEYSGLISKTSSKELSLFATKLHTLKKTAMHEMLSTCRLEGRFLFADFPGNDLYLYTYCSDNPKTRIAVQIKNSQGKWITYTNFQLKKDPACSPGSYSLGESVELGLLRTRRGVLGAKSFRVKYFTLDSSKFRLYSFFGDRLNSNYSCLNPWDNENGNGNEWVLGNLGLWFNNDC